MGGVNGGYDVTTGVFEGVTLLQNAAIRMFGAGHNLRSGYIYRHNLRLVLR